MRQATILYKDMEAGILTQHDDETFTFRYHKDWFIDNTKPPISLTLPKDQQEYHSKTLFAFFHNMLPEGVNKQAVCRYNKIDQHDYFGLLRAIAKYDTIGAIRVIEIQDILK